MKKIMLLAIFLSVHVLGVMNKEELVKANDPKTLKEASLILDVSENAKEVEVDQAFRSLQSKYHPDRVMADDKEGKNNATIIAQKLVAAKDIFKKSFAKKEAEQAAIKRKQEDALRNQEAATKAGTATLNDVMQNIINAHARAFTADNLFKPGILPADETSWKNAVHGLILYVKAILEKPRSFGQGISSSNQDLLQKNIEIVLDASNKLIVIIKAVSLGKFDKNKAQAALVMYSDKLKQVQKDLVPGFLDVLDIKDSKNALSKTAMILETTMTKAKKDLNK